MRQPRRQSVGARCEAREAPVEIAPPHASRLRILLGGQHEEVVCRQTHHVAGQHFEQRSRVRRVRQRLHEPGHHAHLGSRREQRPSRHGALEALVAQRPGVRLGTRHLAQQHHHVARRVPARPQRGEPPGDGAGAGGLRVVDPHAAPARGGAQGQHQIDARAVAAVRRRAPLVRLERHEAVPEHVGLLEHTVHEREHVGMAAEILRKLHVERAHLARAHRALVGLVHVHVGPAEAVDGLLRVAHGAQARKPRPGQVGHQVYLQLARVLELVHHDQLEAVGVAAGHVWVLLEGGQRPHQQIVVVQLAQGALLVLVAARHVARERHELGRARPGQAQR